MLKKTLAALAAVMAAGSLSACSSVIEGTSQEIVINTNPSGADCALQRKGTTIARVQQTPGGVTIKKTKYDITILCDKTGYQQASYLNHSGVAGATFGNIVLGGGVGWAIDSASGADNKYDSPVNISLVPVGTASVTPSTPATATPAAAPKPPTAPASPTS